MAKKKNERVVMQNPNTGKEDGTIAREMYEPVRAAILTALTEEGDIAFADLKAAILKRTPSKMWENASPGWYTTTVKLDVEARGLITRQGSPQVLRLTEKGKEALPG